MDGAERESRMARICLPMATDSAFFCTGRALLDGMRDGELPTTFFRSLLVTVLSMMTQFPEDELRRCPGRIQQVSMDRAVDRRDADDAAAMLQFDAANDFLRRPAILQDADLHKGAQGCILQALVWPASGSAPSVAGLRSQRLVWHGLLGWSRIAAKLTRDGGLAPAQQMCNLRDGFAASKKKEYLFALKWCKMGVVARSYLSCMGIFVRKYLYSLMIM